MWHLILPLILLHKSLNWARCNKFVSLLLISASMSLVGLFVVLFCFYTYNMLFCMARDSAARPFRYVGIMILSESADGDCFSGRL